MDYKNTIITPKTAFPMKAGLPNREPGMLEKWNEMDLYGQLLEKNQDCPRFILHDGPPFSNGDIHMGHALNKTLKDFIVRARAMQGYYTPYVPGWDNHGMPIESAIIKKNKLNHKTMPVPEFRSACEQFAQDYIDRQREGFRRLGVIGDWAHPYKTMDKAFEAEEVKIFGAMYRKGYIYKGLKPVYWCPKDETALAEAEIEYADDACTSIYVKFALNQDFGKLAPFGGVANTYVIIWTTTPWTLPGNLAIAFHPTEEYVLLDQGLPEMMEQVIRTEYALGITLPQCQQELHRELRMRHRKDPSPEPSTEDGERKRQGQTDSLTGLPHLVEGMPAEKQKTFRELVGEILELCNP